MSVATATSKIGIVEAARSTMVMAAGKRWAERCYLRWEFWEPRPPSCCASLAWSHHVSVSSEQRMRLRLQHRSRYAA